MDKTPKFASELSLPSAGASYAVADGDDYPHLSAAENAGCDAFLTVDKALWVLNPIDHQAVLSPREFWDRLLVQCLSSLGHYAGFSIAI